MANKSNNVASVSLADMPLRARSYWIVAVSSMEQILGAGLTTVVGVMLPMMQLASHTELSAVMQGVVGASGLVGIAAGSPLLGRLSDRYGYLLWFRLCPVIIMIGALLAWLCPSIPCLVAGLFVAGVGVGGGYSLDSSYITELLPKRWRQVMVGVAKASSALGFLGVALVCWLAIESHPNPAMWSDLILIIGFMALATLLMRIYWAESPKWLLTHGRKAEAQRSVTLFYGPGVTIDEEDTQVQQTNGDVPSWSSMFRGENLRKAILCGVPWACEGLGVYGFGVFLPVLVMALGIDSHAVNDLHSIEISVEVTSLVNFFILPGFVIGLLLVNRVDHIKLMSWGFVLSALGLGLLYLGYVLDLPTWVMIVGFVVFEVALNAGPHLVTYILPPQVYPVAVRGTGSGLAAMNGKIGAVAGVVVMPLLLSAGGAGLVLLVSIGVMLLGAVIGMVFRPKSSVSPAKSV